MGKSQRLTLGIILNFSSKWMGGVIYIINVVKILNWLDDKEKPEVVLFYRPDLQRFVDEIDYPYLEKVPWRFPAVYTTYLQSWLTGKNQFVAPLLGYTRLDALFPLHDFPFTVEKNGVKLVSWYADLQHKHYPGFFSRKKRLERDARIRLILRNCRDLVVSSQAVANDFHTFFRLPSKMKIHLFHFASVVDNFDFSGIKLLLEKSHIPERYFMVSNQFHQHKNHQILLEALALLKQRGIKPFIAITGKLPEDDDSPYIRRLRQLMKQHGLQQQVCFLGVLSRHDQLTLMRYAQAVIQPSLFEGWSTVIEDAISLQTPVIAADLEVNLEQLGEKGTYFPRNDTARLAEILSEYPERRDFDTEIYEPYDEHIRRAAKTFISIFLAQSNT